MTRCLFSSLLLSVLALGCRETRKQSEEYTYASPMVQHKSIHFADSELPDADVKVKRLERALDSLVSCLEENPEGFEACGCESDLMRSDLPKPADASVYCAAYQKDLESGREKSDDYLVLAAADVPVPTTVLAILAAECDETADGELAALRGVTDVAELKIHLCSCMVATTSMQPPPSYEINSLSKLAQFLTDSQPAIERACTPDVY